MIDLKKMRTELNLKQKDVAEILGITQAAWSKIEVGKAELTERNKKALIEKLNINSKWLETGEEPIYWSGEFKDELVEYIVSTAQLLDKRDKKLLCNLMCSMVDNKE